MEMFLNLFLWDINLKAKYQKHIEKLVLEKDRVRRYRYHKQNWMFCVDLK